MKKILKTTLLVLMFLGISIFVNGMPRVINYEDWVPRNNAPKTRYGRLYYDERYSSFMFYDGTTWKYLRPFTTLEGGVESFTAGDSLTGDATTGDITVNVDDDFIKNTGDTGTGVYDFGGATSFEIVNTTSPTVNAAGEIAIDTDADGDYIDQGLICYYDGTQVMYGVALDTIPSTDNYVLAYDASNDKYVFQAETGSGTTYSAGTGLTLTGTQFSTNDSQIDHDNLSNFTVTEHFTEASITITSGQMSDFDSASTALIEGYGYITATLTEEEVEDYAGGMVTGNTETRIAVTYEDGDGTLDFVVTDMLNIITCPDANATAGTAITFADTGITTITEAADTITFDATEAQDLDDVCEIGATTDVAITTSSSLEGNTITESGNAIYNATETPGGELGGTFASFTIDDSIAVSNWNLTTPTITTSLTTDSKTISEAEIGRLDGLAGIIVTDITSCTDIEGTLLSITAGTLNATEAQNLAAVLAIGADGNDVDQTSLGKLEFFDAGLYLDADADGVMNITSDGTLELHSADWDISTTGVQTNMGSITSDGTIEGATVTQGGQTMYDANDTPSGELGGTYASITIDDGVAVSSWTLTTPVITGGATFTDADITPNAVAELVYDNTVTGIDDGCFNWYDDDEVKYIVDYPTLPTDAEDDYHLAYDKDTDEMYWRADASGGGNDIYVEEGDAAKANSGGADLYIDFDGTDFDVGVVGNETNITIPNDGHLHTNASITLASTDLTDTADLLYETELDDFSELQTQISDKTLINEEDAIIFDSTVTFNGKVAIGDGGDTVTISSTGLDLDASGNITNATLDADNNTVSNIVIGAECTGASTALTDTADLLYEAELDSFSELDTQIADKALINLADGGTFTGNIIANANLSVGNAATTAGVLTLLEDDDDGANFASFMVPALTANTVYTLPPDDGDNTEVLQTDGSGSLTWVAQTGGDLVDDATPQLGGDLDLNSKNIDFPTTANVSDVKDEDNFASDSATMLATQQSIKAYVDANAAATGASVKGVLSGLDVTYSADHFTRITSGVYSDHTGTKRTVSAQDIACGTNTSDFEYIYIEYDSGTTIYASTTEPTRNSSGIYVKGDDANAYYIGEILTDSSDDSWIFSYSDGYVQYSDFDNHRLLSAGAATSYTDVDCSGHVPSNCELMRFYARLAANASNYKVYIRTNGVGGTYGTVRLRTADDEEVNESFLMNTDSAQIIEYNNENAAVDTYLWAQGYKRNRPLGTGGGTEVNNLESVCTDIETTEIFIGNASNAGVYASLSSEATMDNTGAVTLADSVAVTNWNLTTPTFTTTALLVGILQDNDDMVFECDADNDGSNKFSFTDGAATEVAALTEAGALQIDSTLDVDGASIDVGSDPADAGAIRLDNAASIAWEDATECTITHVDDTGLLINLELEVDGTLDADGIVELGDGGDNFSVASDGVDIDTAGAISNVTTLTADRVKIGGVTTVSIGWDVSAVTNIQLKCNDDAASVTVVDAQGNHDGTIQGGDDTEDLTIATLAAMTPGFHFDGAADYIQVATHADIDILAAESFSYAIWFKTDDSSPGTQMALVDKLVSANQEGYRMFIRSDNGHLECSIEQADNTNTEIQGDTDIVDNGWHLAIFVRDVTNDELRLYVDGTEDAVAVTDATTATLSSASNLYIGRSNNATPVYYDGIVDNFIFFKDHAITDAEATGLYVASAGTEDLLNADGTNVHAIASTATVTPDKLTDLANSLYIEGDIEIDGIGYFDSASGIDVSGGDIILENDEYIDNSVDGEVSLYDGDATQMLMIGKNSTTIYGTEAAASLHQYCYSDTAAHGGKWNAYKSNVDVTGSLVATASGDTLSQWTSYGVDSTTAQDKGAFIEFRQNGAVGVRVPTDIVFTPFTSTAAVQDAVRIEPDGGLFATALNSDTGTTLVLNGSNEICTDSSSEKYKKNIRYLDVLKTDVLSLVGKKYETKHSNTTSIGLIVEDVALKCPDLVVYRNTEKQLIDVEEENDEGEMEITPTWVDVECEPYPDAISYDRLTVLLLEIVKEQQIQIDDLIKRVEKLEKE